MINDNVKGRSGACGTSYHRPMTNKRQQREEQREHHRAEQGSSRVHCESGKYSHDMSNSDKRRVRNAEIADSWEAMTY